MFKWNENYITGVELIDEQHKKLFEIGNRAYDLLKNTFYTDKYDKIVEIILELKDYTIFHFKTEEQYLLSIKCPTFFSHKVEHDDFIKKLESIDLSNIDNSQEEYILELMTVVFKWIDEHIFQKDKFALAK
jgi:hemerythrin